MKCFVCVSATENPEIVYVSVYEDSTVTVPPSYGEPKDIDTYFPKSVIALVGLGLCLIIGILVAKAVDKIHDQLSLRDDASDMSDHTRDLLKARFAIFAFTDGKGVDDVRDARLRDLDRARKFGRIWMARAAISRRKKKDKSKLAVPVTNKDTNSSNKVQEPGAPNKVTLVSFKPKEEAISETGEEYENEKNLQINNKIKKDFVAIDIMDKRPSNPVGKTGIDQVYSIPMQYEYKQFGEVGNDIMIPIRVSTDETPRTNPDSFDCSSLTSVMSNCISVQEKDEDKATLKEFSSDSDLQDETIYQRKNSTSGNIMSIESELPSKPIRPNIPKILKKLNSSVLGGKSISMYRGDLPNVQTKDAWKETKPARPVSSKRPLSSKANISRPVTAGTSRLISAGGRKSAKGKRPTITR